MVGTGDHEQVVVVTLKVGEDIGNELHLLTVDQTVADNVAAVVAYLEQHDIA